ncbi:unnamed protein product [Phytophthora fragariaefolia]|uniref:Unnamed protein product n=1 Tax=Phytophthora fragariaefolia TaxID=1490495 RepID=A0A9W6X7A1_9STRA|nr:unnamed protein product [Phytophthora fragariaefolia]
MACQQRILLKSCGFGKDSEEDNDVVNTDEVLVRQSGILKNAVLHQDYVKNGCVNAMVKILRNSDESPSIHVTRHANPVSEWDENGELLGGAFPIIFLIGGKMLPHGSIPKELLTHWMGYYDGRFESNLIFVVTIFNQLLRQAAFQMAARVETSHAKILAKFGVVASSNIFKKCLLHSSQNLRSIEAKRFNAALLRILSLVGGCVPFSPFERSASRPNNSAMGYRYGIPLHWVTIAPPKHASLMLHQIAQLRTSRKWNDNAELSRIQQSGWSSLPDEIRASPRARLHVSNRFPGLAALVFEHCLTVVTEHNLRYPISNTTRVSRDYTTRETGCYGKVAAFNGVVEPRVDVAVAHWFDGISLNRISVEARTWEEEWKKQQSYTATRPAAVHESETQPLVIKVVNQEKGKRVKFSYQPGDGILGKQLDDGYCPENGDINAETCDPIVCEQHRPNQDSMFVETTIGLAAFTASHTNSSIMNGADAGTAVEESQLACMTKEGAELKNTAVVMLTALEHISKFPPTNDMTNTFAKIAADINKMQTNTQAYFPSNRDGHEINNSIRGSSHTSVGDFLQLIVLMGTPICKAMYENSNNETINQARICLVPSRVFSWYNNNDLDPATAYIKTYTNAKNYQHIIHVVNAGPKMIFQISTPSVMKLLIL